WILGRVSETQRRRRIRIQLILTTFVIVANMIGVGVSILIETVLFPTPNVFRSDVWWITTIVAPAYIVLAFLVGVVWATNRVIQSVRWALEERTPTVEDQRNTFRAPGQLTRVLLFLWGAGAVLLTTLYALHDTQFIPKLLLGVTFPGIVVSTSCNLYTEFALRPVAADALQAGRPPSRLAPGIMGRTMVVWAFGSGVPMLGVLLAAVFALTQTTLTPTQFAFAVLVLAVFALVFGALLMWIVAWLTASPIRIVREALSRVERGDLTTDLVVFDGTELGQLQRGFNSMVHGLRERERVRDLFGRHVGREVAALAEQEKPELGGEERHAAVIFVDVIGSTQLVTSRPAAEVVELLNRFFAVIVDEGPLADVGAVVARRIDAAGDSRRQRPSADLHRRPRERSGWSIDPRRLRLRRNPPRRGRCAVCPAQQLPDPAASGLGRRLRRRDSATVRRTSRIARRTGRVDGNDGRRHARSVLADTARRRH
ncbi:MAG: adenylate/guanylate cyclase domain-containing protein, partial [Actinobacteria bacterium]|nr:adenylate/guanylate cyclase domain-containing protein [Actinomycetota bacterium]